MVKTPVVWQVKSRLFGPDLDAFAALLIDLEMASGIVRRLAAIGPLILAVSLDGSGSMLTCELGLDLCAVDLAVVIWVN